MASMSSPVAVAISVVLRKFGNHLRPRAPASPNGVPLLLQRCAAADVAPPLGQCAQTLQTEATQAAAGAAAGTGTGTGTGAGAGAEEVQVVSEPAQSQKQQRNELQQQRGGSLQGRSASQVSPVFSDILSPWFPGDRSLHQMLNTVDSMFDDMLAPGWPFRGSLGVSPIGQQRRQLVPSWVESQLAVRPPWDVQEDKSAYHLRFDLPGMSKEEVKLNVGNDGVLSISAEHKDKTKEGDMWESRFSRKYQTTIQLPEDIKDEGIRAEMKNGVLSVTVPKLPLEEVHAAPRQIEVA